MRAKARFICCLLLLVGAAASAEDGYGPLIARGLDEQLAIGADLFFSETFAGNGRTCATCHLATENYTLPADLTGLSDQIPLMVGDPDNPNHVEGIELCDTIDGSENCQAIRQSGLILVNADGVQPGIDGVSPSFVMRSIPHVLSLSRTIAPPTGGLANATGWSGDGSPGTGSLNEFATGAVRQHFTLDVGRVPGEDFLPPTQEQLDAMEAFQLELGRRNQIDLPALRFFEANATDGKDIFKGPNRRCSICHASAGRLPADVLGNFNTHIEEDRVEDCENSSPPHAPGQCAGESATLVAGANFDGGFGEDDFPGDTRWGDGTFNIPPLVEAADTAPFFHDNRRTSLEQAISFYRSASFLASPFCNGPGTLDCGLENTAPGVAERQVGAMLRILNAGFNLSMAAQRLKSAFELLSTEPGTDPTVIKTLVLAREEIADARAIIDASVTFGNQPVFLDTGGHLTTARSGLDLALTWLDSLIANGATGLQVVSVLAQVVAAADDHLSDDFYDEDLASCPSGETLPPGQYHDCRWLYDLGEANLLFDNAGVTPSIVAAETELTWTPNPGGTATLKATWRTAEWTNPLFDETVLTAVGGDPTFGPVTFTGSATQLPDGRFERVYTTTIPCRPNTKYRMDVSARVGGVTETDFDMAKASRYCIGS